jgi:DNA-binding ferritin-like protein
MKFKKRGSYDWVDEFFNLPTITEQNTEVKRLTERLKEYSDMMGPVYSEIENRINETNFPKGRIEVMVTIIKAAIASGHKKELKTGKNGIKDIKEMQKKIFNTADKLINLLNEYENILTGNLLTSKACTKPMKLILKAGISMPPLNRRIFFKKNIASVLGMDNPILNSATANGNMPTLQEVLQALKSEMSKDSVISTNRSLTSILDSRKSTTTTDFINFFLTDLSTSMYAGVLPDDFSLTARAVATITGCVLDIDDGEGVTEGSVKKAWDRVGERRHKRR